MKSNDTSLTSTQLYEHYPVEFTPFWRTYPFYIVVAFIVLLIVLLISRFVIQVIKRRPVPPLSSSAQALQELDGIKKSVTQGMPEKEAYYALTSIMKRYLQKRYDVALEDKTDTEMMSWLQDVSFPYDVRSTLQQFFKQAYAIKFSDSSDEGGIQERIKQLEMVIAQTQPAPAQNKR